MKRCLHSVYRKARPDAARNAGYTDQCRRRATHGDYCFQHKEAKP